MTHTMHRCSHAHDDFVIHIRSTADTKEGSGEKVRACLDALLPLGPDNFGSPPIESPLSMSAESVRQGIRDGVPLHIVFGRKEALVQALHRLRDLDTGLSVTVAGPLNVLRQLAEQGAFTPAGMQIELNTFTQPSFISEEPWIEEILSLCGHLRVSPFLARQLLDDIRHGKTHPEEAAQKLGRVCKCGCFNVAAAAAVLGREQGAFPA